jgi:L-histidine N-alpha-methyltransferase
MPNQATEPRVRVDVLLDEADRRSTLHDATFWSLRADPKELPAVWLYDEAGSMLFEQITRLPEYYLSGAEREILAGQAAEIAATSGAHTLVELGAGSSDKTRLLLDALENAGTLERFVPLDASDEILRVSAEAIAARYRSIAVHAIVGDFERHLHALPSGGRRLIAFLGSTVGNLYRQRRHALFAEVAAVCRPDDWFLLGVDLVKDPCTIEAAYNDTRGVTERFVRNALTAINRELDAGFDQSRFAFEPYWDRDEEWMDIGFRSRAQQSVPVRGLEVNVDFAAGERLRIEISAKFRLTAIERELAAANLTLRHAWTDTQRRFALLLAGPRWTARYRQPASPSARPLHVR